MTHLWPNLLLRPNAPDLIHAVVEVSRDSRNRCKYNKGMGIIQFDRITVHSVIRPIGFLQRRLKPGAKNSSHLQFFLGDGCLKCPFG
jgi:inorganic pyrophosphatase